MQSPEGSVWAENAEGGGNSLSSMHAEGKALYRGLQRAREMRIQYLLIKSDALRIVNIVNGKEKCLVDFEPIFEDIRRILEDFNAYNLVFVRSEFNERAHVLAMNRLCK